MKGPKGLQMCFIAVRKTGKRSGFVIYSDSKTSIKRTPTKRTPSIKRTLSRVPEINVLYICIYNEPLLSGRAY